MDFFVKETYTEADIQSLISLKFEESINLDFKASGSLQNTDGKKIEIAKDVSAFANSDGGIIVYGISEIDHKADSYSFIDGDEFTKEWLEQIIQSRISRRIPNVKIFPVRINDELLKTVYIVKIPSSSSAPHMTSDKRFYKRYNFQSIQMEEYEIRELYNRKDKTELNIEDVIISSNGGSSNGQSYLTNARFKIDFQVSNVSNSIEHQYKLQISIPKGILQVINNGIANRLIRHEEVSSIFSISNESPIFQDERTTAISIHIVLDGYQYSQLCKVPITVKLYYSNGVKVREFQIANQLEYDGRLLEEWDWCHS